MNMTKTATELKGEIKKSLDLMHTLSDEARVKLHLASMDAKTAWEKLEPTLLEAERIAEDASEKTLHAIVATTDKLKKLVASI